MGFFNSRTIHDSMVISLAKILNIYTVSFPFVSVQIISIIYCGRRSLTNLYVAE